MSHLIKAANQFFSERYLPILDAEGSHRLAFTFETLFHKIFPTISAGSVKEILPILDETLESFLANVEQRAVTDTWETKDVIVALDLTWTTIGEMGRRGIFQGTTGVPQTSEDPIIMGNLLSEEDFASLSQVLRLAFYLDCAERAKQMQEELKIIWKSLNMKELMRFLYTYNISFKK